MSDLVFEEYNKQLLIVKGDRLKYGDIIKSIGGIWNSQLKEGGGWLLHISNKSRIIKLIDEINKSKKLEYIQNNTKSRKHQYKYRRALSETSDSNNDSDIDNDNDNDNYNNIDIDNESCNKENSTKKYEEELLKEIHISKSIEEKNKFEEEKKIYEESIKKKHHNKEEKNKMREEIKRLEYLKKNKDDNNRKDIDREDNTIEYYKKFKKKPSDFKELFTNKEEYFSSSNTSKDSSSDDFPSPSTPRKKEKYVKPTDMIDKTIQIQNLKRQMYEMQIKNEKLRVKK